MSASERLRAAQEQQMLLIEKDSTKLCDHILFWEAVRTENGLLYAARQKGITTLNGFPVPALAVSSSKAKQAIEMQLLLTELLNTTWGRDAWTLTDTSYERYLLEPKCTLKKGPRVVEVMYDNDPANRMCYTAWSLLYMRTPAGWLFATGGADECGLYYTDMTAVRHYYDFFGRDAARYGSTGTWTVRDQDRVFYSGPLSLRPESGWSEPAERPEDSPDRAVPYPSAGTPSGFGPIRSSQYRSRTHSRPSPYGSNQCQGVLLRCDSTSSLSSPVSVGLERGEEGEETPPSPDSTDVVTPPSTPPDPNKFSLFKTSGGQQCLLLSGSGNQAKCFRFRMKKGHRHKYVHCTTTWWTVGDEGAERRGQASLLVTFDSPTQRELFLKTVPIPESMTVQGLTVQADF